MGRRSFTRGGLGALTVALLGGCGWSPVYRAAGPASPDVAAALAAVNVRLIPERSGQLLRNALQERLERGYGAAAPRYDLAASFALAEEGVAIAQDSTSTRIRITGTAVFTLQSHDVGQSTLLSGTARSLDGLNAIGQEFFSQDLEREAITRRIAEALADQIALQLAAYFHRTPQIA